MPYNEHLANRVRRMIGTRRGIVEKEMFGGLAFMLNGNMCCGVEKNRLVLRVGSDQFLKILKRPGAKPMDFTGRPMKGFVYVSPDAFNTDGALKKWLEPAIKYSGGLPPKIKKRKSGK